MCAAALGWVGFHMSKREEGNARIEMRCGDIALLPFYYAETDRMLLKQLKKNRDYEEKLMKNVPGWEVGKWKGYQVFLSVGPNEYFKPSLLEFFAHGDPDVMWKVHHAVQNS